MVETRELGRTGRPVGVVGFGAWQIGADWGTVVDDAALAALEAAVDAGVTFVDTADVYGDGRSERFVGELLRRRPDAGLTVATKLGRRANPHVAGAYTLDAFRAWTDRSRENLGVDTLDLVQLHCPPPEVYSRDAVFDALGTLVEEKRVRGLRRQRRDLRRGAGRAAPARGGHHPDHPQLLPPEADRRGAPGGRRGRRRHHRPGAAGQRAAVRPLRRVDDVRAERPPHLQPRRRGVRRRRDVLGRPVRGRRRAAREIAALTPPDVSTAQLALRWILDQPGVSVVIPGARGPEQAVANAAAAGLAPLDASTAAAIGRVYAERIRPLVHDRW
nr:aldo/keto reductase [Jiangella alkaliphila]